MSKQIHNPTLDKDPLALNVPVGGTSDIKAPLAAEAIGLLRTATLGQPNSAVQLDANGAVPSSFLDSSLIGSAVTLSYMVTVVKGSINKFTITNYASDKTYVLGATHGKISRVDDVVTYVAPLVAVPDTITINNESFDLTVFTDFLLPPSILSPTKGAGMVGKSLVVKSTDLKMKEGHEAFKLVASDAVPGDNYGFSVSISDNNSTIVVGAYTEDNINGVDAGAAYIYKWDGTSWIETKLIASDGAAGDRFGVSVDVNSANDTTVVVGSYGDDNVNGIDAGAAYVYKWSGAAWIETKIIASDSAAGDWFGISVSISNDGNTVVIGAYADDNTNGVDAGAAYIYRFDGTNWIETKILASDGATGDRFGWRTSVSNDGNTVVATSRFNDNTNGANAGAVYIYKFDGTNWIETKLIASDGAAGDEFSYSVNVAGDGLSVVVGAIYKKNDSYGNGAAYVYKFDGTSWIETRIEPIIVSNIEIAMFGHSVDINDLGDKITIGAKHNAVDSFYSHGTTYSYQFDGVKWTGTILLASDGISRDMAGHSTSISGDGSLIVSGGNGDTTGTGRAYIFNPVYHTQTQYQLSTDPNFVNIVQDLTVDGPISEYTLTNLSVSTEYYLRVRYVGGSQGFSGWSNVLHFTTDVEFIPNVELAKIIASDSSAGDDFGYSVSISDNRNTILTGAPFNDNVNGVDAGAAYIYRFDGASWIETKILASDGAAGDRFGWRTSTNSDGTTIVVGARFDDNTNGVDAGAAYIYKFDGTNWIETKLIASDGATGDDFGWYTSISDDGNTIVISARLDDISSSNMGSAYIYKFNGTSWIETKLTASDGANEDLFGWALSISGDGDTVAISAINADTVNGVNAGATYIYKFDGTNWVETKLTASDGAANDWYGTQIDVNIDGTTIVVGADGVDNANGIDAGAAYIYKFDGTNWIETKLIASDGAAGDQFGWPIVINDDSSIILVGARNADIDGETDTGVFYIFKYDGVNWVETKVVENKQLANNTFGRSLSMTGDGSMLLTSSLTDKNVVDNSGVIYVYGT